MYDYDLNGNLLSITDPVSNVTSYKYDEFDRLVREVVTVNSQVLTRSWQYDVTSNLLAKTDRQGRSMAYQYDNLDRQVAETWIDATGTPTNTVYSLYDIQGRLTDTEDDFSAYSYTFDDLDRVLSVSNAGTPGVAEVILFSEYDDQNRRKELRAEIDGDDDFINTYAYNGRNQLTQILQDDQAVNAVAYKRVEFDYDVADQLDQIRRYASSGTSHLVATTSHSYDGSGRLDGIVHAKGMTTLADYAWQFDEANRISQFVFSALVDPMSTSTGTQTSDYSYDDRGQLVGAAHDYQADEDYTYDSNGNRTTGIDSDTYSNATYTTGDHNRLESDGIYDYEYDAEGNRTRRTHIVNDTVTDYTWDVKNRLVNVTEYATTSDADLETDPTQIVEYTYDMFNRRIAKQADTDGDTIVDKTIRYVYDGDHIALQFEGTTDADNAADLAHRYVFGQEIDQILADERVSSLLTDGDVLWALTDNLGSVRQLAEHDSGMNATTIENYLEYDAFGNITREETPTIDHVFGYTGRERDEETGLHFYRARYYDPVAGRFISEDPIGFQAEDANLNRYVKNKSTYSKDPTGKYDLGGHFWTTYYVAHAAGIQNQKERYDLAYFSQLPDQVPDFSAADLGLQSVLLMYVETAPIRLVNSVQTLAIKSQYAWSIDVFDWIHSLHGGDATVVAERRRDLTAMLHDGSFDTWQRGVVIHALGDAYAHVDNSGRAYGWPEGHALRGFHWMPYDESHRVDSISYGSNHARFTEYVRTLYEALGGTNFVGNKNLQDYLKMLKEIPGHHNPADTISAENHWARIYCYGRQDFQDVYNQHEYEPEDEHNTDRNQRVVTHAEMRDLIDKMKQFAIHNTPIQPTLPAISPGSSIPVRDPNFNPYGGYNGKMPSLDSLM